MSSETDTSPNIEMPTALEHRWHQLRLVESRVSEQLEHALQREHELTLSEFCALAALAYSDDGGHLRQQILAEAIPLNQSSVSRLVGRLENDGLTERYLCPTDRRGVYTQITDRGRNKLLQARPTYLRVLEYALGEIGRDDYLGRVLTGLVE
ncbi:MarR family winged helix-turn-helix transcriptional regulator [Actinopolyspora alba]|nr:MarR family transcriptional regulator [Actinopolyspora alba]